MRPSLTNILWVAALFACSVESVAESIQETSKVSVKEYEAGNQTEVDGTTRITVHTTRTITKTLVLLTTVANSESHNSTTSGTSANRPVPSQVDKENVPNKNLPNEVTPTKINDMTLTPDKGTDAETTTTNNNNDQPKSSKNIIPTTSSYNVSTSSKHYVADPSKGQEQSLTSTTLKSDLTNTTTRNDIPTPTERPNIESTQIEQVSSKPPNKTSHVEEEKPNPTEIIDENLPSTVRPSKGLPTKVEPNKGPPSKIVDEQPAMSISTLNQSTSRKDAPNQNASSNVASSNVASSNVASSKKELDKPTSTKSDSTNDEKVKEPITPTSSRDSAHKSTIAGSPTGVVATSTNPSATNAAQAYYSKNSVTFLDKQLGALLYGSKTRVGDGTVMDFGTTTIKYPENWAEIESVAYLPGTLDVITKSGVVLNACAFDRNAVKTSALAVTLRTKVAWIPEGGIHPTYHTVLAASYTGLLSMLKKEVPEVTNTVPWIWSCEPQWGEGEPNAHVAMSMFTQHTGATTTLKGVYTGGVGNQNPPASPGPMAPEPVGNPTISTPTSTKNPGNENPSENPDHQPIASGTSEKSQATRSPGPPQHSSNLPDSNSPNPNSQDPNLSTITNLPIPVVLIPTKINSGGGGVSIPGGPVVAPGATGTISGHTIVVPDQPSASHIIFDGSTVSILVPTPDASPAPPVPTGIKVGSTIVPVNFETTPGGGLILSSGGPALKPGGHTQWNGQLLSLASSGNKVYIVDGDKTSMVDIMFMEPTVNPTIQPVVFKSTTLATETGGGIILPGGSTLAPGSKTVIDGITLVAPAPTRSRTGGFTSTTKEPEKTKPPLVSFGAARKLKAWSAMSWVVVLGVVGWCALR
ncbi:hypothetical protein B0J11DRAFT_511718 [Dendryphion nanum]|uniref:Uncharacterized protein n=1 Tax=Dendryphion nanum TaxID=256645 RepID=A0A9P9I9F0_9PLEO|nr:hypothetical protein B0J11DRAFT_511718 [Dendryphion nanum]